MNKSEIAELARKIFEFGNSSTGEWRSETIAQFVERAIAESQQVTVQTNPPFILSDDCESNSITYRAPEVVSNEPEPEKCPTCNGYHLGGCHRAELGDDGEPSPLDHCNCAAGDDACLACHADWCNFGRVRSLAKNLAKRSGAAQEVSPMCPLCKKSARFMRQPGTCSHPFHDEPFRRKVEEVSPPSPEPKLSADDLEKYPGEFLLLRGYSQSQKFDWQQVVWLMLDYRRTCIESRAEGDTRELKAALEAIIHGSLAAEGMFSPCHICRPSDEHRHEEGCPILLAERVLDPD